MSINQIGTITQEGGIISTGGVQKFLNSIDPGLTTSARALHSVLVVANELGVKIPPGIMAGDQGAALENIDIEGRVALRDTVAAANCLAELSKDDGIGLVVGSRAVQLHPGYFIAASGSAANLGQAVEVAVHMVPVIAEVGHIRSEKVDGGLRLSLHFSNPAFRGLRVVTDLLFSYIIAGLKDSCSRPVWPKRVGLCYPPSGDVSRLSRFYGPKISFEQPVGYIEFGGDDLSLPMCNPHRELHNVVVKSANRVVEELNGQSEFRKTVAVHVGALLKNGNPGLGEVAERMHMSRRTLQRRLDTGGISFRDILRRERHALALQLLDQTTLSIGDIAFRLGFANQSAFSRAFKQVEGISPRAFRLAK